MSVVLAIALHVSSTTVLILRRSYCIITASVVLAIASTTLNSTSLCLTCVLNSHLKRVTRTDAVIIQYDLLRMSTIMLETCREM